MVRLSMSSLVGGATWQAPRAMSASVMSHAARAAVQNNIVPL